MTSYPGAIYSPREKQNRSGVVFDSTKKTVVFAEDIVDDDNEIVAVETELGLNPKGSDASVAARLDRIESVLPAPGNDHSLTLLRSSSQYIGIADAAQTGLDLSSALTFEMWLKFGSTPFDGDGSYLSTKAASFNSTASWQFRYFSDSGTAKLELIVCDGSGNDAKTQAQDLGTSGWHHVAVTWDGATKKFNFYVGGAQIGSEQTGSNVASIRNGSEPFNIGGKNNSANFDAKICLVRVWNVVRTAAQIAANYNKVIEGSASGLVLNSRLNNDYVDESGNSNDLTPSGSPAFSTDVPF